MGLSKVEAEKTFGGQLAAWRHGWDTAPPPITSFARREWEKLPQSQMITTFRSAEKDFQILEKGRAWCGSVPHMPLTESLKDCCDRVLPLFARGVAPHLVDGKTLLVVSHANTCKALLRVLDPHVVTELAFSKLKIPNSTPLIYEFEPDSSSEAIPGGLSVVPFLGENKGTKEELRHSLRGRWLEHGKTEIQKDLKVA